MNNTEYTEDTLEERAREAAKQMVLDPAFMSVNDWEALRDYAQVMLYENDAAETPF